MLPALLLVFEEPHPEWLRKWALVLFTPIPYLLLLTKLGLPGHLAISGFAVALMGVMGYAQLRGSVRAMPARLSQATVPDSVH